MAEDLTQPQLRDCCHAFFFRRIPKRNRRTLNLLTSSTLDQIVPGETTETWIIATLGQPDERTTVEGAENVAILKYRHVVDREDDGAVFLIFAGSTRTKRQSVTYFEIVDGVVNRYWIERARL